MNDTIGIVILMIFIIVMWEAESVGTSLGKLHKAYTVEMNKTDG